MRKEQSRDEEGPRLVEGHSRGTLKPIAFAKQDTSSTDERPPPPPAPKPAIIGGRQKVG